MKYRLEGAHWEQVAEIWNVLVLPRVQLPALFFFLPLDFSALFIFSPMHMAVHLKSPASCVATKNAGRKQRLVAAISEPERRLVSRSEAGKNSKAKRTNCISARTGSALGHQSTFPFIPPISLSRGGAGRNGYYGYLKYEGVIKFYFRSIR